MGKPTRGLPIYMERTMRRKLIVLSFDALQSNDADVLKRLPYCSELFKGAAIVRSVLI